MDQIAWALLGFASAFCIALSSGIVASVLNTQWVQAIVWAELLTAAGLAVFYLAQLGFLTYIPAGHLVFSFFGLTLLTVVSLRMAVRFAGRKLESNWQRESSESGREPVWVRFFASSGFWRAAFRWDTRKARDRNPIAWLQEYNWTSRLTKWGWCALLFVAEMRMLSQFRVYIDYQMQLFYLTCLGIAFSAAASFRRERQTGALELLLVTPISARHLIWGRLQGVWFHFLPAFAILACVWAMGPQWISLPIRFMFYLAGGYFCLPIIGFYCSLLTANVLISWLLTLFFGLLAPYAFNEMFRWEIGRRNLPIAFFSVQLIFAAVAAGLLYENLTRRRFALQRH